MKLIRIGYWREPDATDWPDPASFVDPDWDSDRREEVVAYLRRGLFSRGMPGYSTCRICGQRNGSVELTDGTYIWPEGLAHYVEQHDLRLPDVFVDHVRETFRRLEDAEVDATWWRMLSS